MKDLRNWLALIRTPGLDWSTLEAMLAALRSSDAIFSAAPRELAPFDLRPHTRKALLAPDWARVDADQVWMQSCECRLLPATDPGFPSMLLRNADAPIALFVRGDASLLRQPQLANVGSRNPTPSLKMGNVGGCRSSRNLMPPVATDRIGRPAT